MIRLSCTLAALVALPLVAAEEGPLTFKEALTNGTTSVFLRARSEIVDQDGKSDNGIANTVRMAIGYTTGAFYGFKASAEFEGVYDLGGSDYSNPVSPDSDRPTILDVGTSNELQQAWVSYDASPFAPGASAKVGRQNINLDNQRWIGAVGWRQDWQSFDAARADYAPKEGALKSVTASAMYLGNVNRIFPEYTDAGTADMHGGVVNIKWKSCDYLDVIGYAYLFDFETTIPNQQSTKTFGLRGLGSYPINDDMKVLYTAEFAKQENYADNPIDISQNYMFGELGLGWKSLSVSIGYEILGGDADEAGNKVTTPVATVHAFNGWADQFVNTPNGGIKDMYIKVGGSIPQVKGLKALAIYHDFKADDAGGTGIEDYGTELDLIVEYSIHQWDPNWLVGTKYANYSAQDFSVDIEKIWVYTQYSF